MILHFVFCQVDILGRFCPGAVKWGDTDVHWTEDKVVCGRSSGYVKDNCNCEYYEKTNLAGPYCSDWVKDDPPFCFLSGRHFGRFCPGAVKWRGTDFYWTEDEMVCESSRGFVEKNCNCSHYDEVDWVGPYCSEWIDGDNPLCFLEGQFVGGFCPGVIKGGNKSLYWT